MRRYGAFIVIPPQELNIAIYGKEVKGQKKKYDGTDINIFTPIANKFQMRVPIYKILQIHHFLNNRRNYFKEFIRL